ncbi:hypothetical protein SDJN02_22702, partial [Cucurbita argyrosperma subsp. argyrosperma]
MAREKERRSDESAPPFGFMMMLMMAHDDDECNTLMYDCEDISLLRVSRMTQECIRWLLYCCMRRVYNFKLLHVKTRN